MHGIPEERRGRQEPRTGHLKTDEYHPKASGILGGPHLGCNGMTETDLRVGSGEEDRVWQCPECFGAHCWTVQSD